jgi:uncharacterized membrane protein YgaE (UPF0421/DUF939 family)
MFDTERAAIREAFTANPRTVRQSLAVAGVYAVQATVCILLLEQAYWVTTFKGVNWAIIAAILALQPGYKQSVVTSIIRILANTVGASVALLVASWLGSNEAYLILSIAIVVVICELLRLELALRTACVAVVIVLTVDPMHVKSTGLERFSATIAGCVAALLVQIGSDAIRKRFMRPPAVEEPQPS